MATPPPLQRQHFHHLLYASTYSTQRVENNVSARLPNITSPSCDLWPLSSWPPKSTFNAFAPNEDLCQFALKLIHSFSKYSVHKLVTNKQTNKRTKGQVENIMPPASLHWRTDKNGICSLSVLHSCVFMMPSAFCPRQQSFASYYGNFRHNFIYPIKK